MELILETKGLTVGFQTKHGRVTAISDVSFSVYRGKVLGIVGESGCGKSVTSLSVLGLLPPETSYVEKGSVRFNGEELLGKSDREMESVRGQNIAMIFQDPMTSLNPVMRVGRQNSETIQEHQGKTAAEAQQLAVEMLRRVDIPSPERRCREYPHQLSGGMKQRVMIAMALACDPDLLIADEPTTALDVTVQAQILDLMREKKESSNIGIMLITHDMGVVAEMADDVLVMYAGKVMEHSGKEALFQDPLHPYTKGLLASIPRLDRTVGRLYSIKGMVPSLHQRPEGCLFAGRCPDRMEVCTAQDPGLVRVGGRQVRCWKYRERGDCGE